MARKILRSARIARLVVKAFHHAVTSVELVLFLHSVKIAISRVNCFVKVHRPTVSIESFSISQVYDDQINAVAICSILYTILSLGACVCIK